LLYDIKKGILMEEIINEISEETLEDLKKVNKPPYPLYYQEVFLAIAKEKGYLEQINPKLLCIESNLNERLINKTSETIENISKTSSNIKENSLKLMEEIEPIEIGEIKNLVLHYSSKLLEEVNKMQSKINELESELDRAYKELLLDPLTKAYNRKAFEKDLEEILKVGKNKDLDVVIAIVDLDHFKSINDTYGHLVGDFVLKKLVELIKGLLRKEDKIYRIGGDEFVIIFNRTHLKNAEKIIDRIVLTIKKTKLKYKKNLIEITVSIGLTMHKKGDTKETIIHRADEALYEAKKSRNKYVIKL
jgi:diguanylate cyclase (GGDEF)-like protein